LFFFSYSIEAFRESILAFFFSSSGLGKRFS
jgi:hypothetical protein